MNKKITLSAIDTQITPIIHAIQYDTDRQLECYFDDIDITGVTAARLYALKPDATEVYTDCTLANGYIIAPLDSQTLAVVGTVNCQMQLTINGTLTTFLFNVIVDKSLVSSSAIPSSNEYTALETLIDEAQDVIDGLPSKVSKSGDSMSGNLDMTDNKIVNLGAPTADADAANKKYVDDTVASVPVITVDSALSDTSENPVQNKVVKNALDGKLDKGSNIDLLGFSISNIGTLGMASNGTINANDATISGIPTPQNNDEPTNKKYVDDADALKFDKAGGTISGAVTINGALGMGGNLNMGNKQINNLAAPAYANSATNKKYVDDADALKEDVANKVTSISAASTDTEYPSAKCMYDLIGDINTILADLATP